MLKKLLIAGIAGTVLSLGLFGAGTASADHEDDWWNNDCYIAESNSIDPECWNMVIWGGVARGWVPIGPLGINNYNPYFLNYYYYGWYGNSFYNQYNYGYPLYGTTTYNYYWWH